MEGWGEAWLNVAAGEARSGATKKQTAGSSQTGRNGFSSGGPFLCIRDLPCLAKKRELSLGDPGHAPLAPFLRWAPHGKAGEGPNTMQSDIRPRFQMRIDVPLVDCDGPITAIFPELPSLQLPSHQTGQLLFLAARACLKSSAAFAGIRGCATFPP